MKKTPAFGSVFFLLLLCLAGICSAELSPSLIAQIQGGESSIVNGTDGIILINVRDVDPKVNITRDNERYENPVNFLINVSYPCAAVVEFYQAEKKSVSMVNITNTTVSDDNKTLTLQVTPLEFYEGISLQELAKKSLTLDQLFNQTFNETKIHYEIIEETPGNSHCDICKLMCKPSMRRDECNAMCIDECR
jgi:hypothetical protein